MASVSQKREILSQIKLIIDLTSRSFTTDDVDCDRLLIDLRQAKRSLSTIVDCLEAENHDAINSTLCATGGSVIIWQRNNYRYL